MRITRTHHNPSRQRAHALLLLLALVSCLALLGVTGSTALAGTYPMHQCSPSAPSIATGWSTDTATTQAVTSLSDDCGSGGLLGVFVESSGEAGAVTENGSNGSHVGLLLSAPGSAPDVTIRSITAKVTASAVTGDDAYLGFSSRGEELPGLTLLKDGSGVGFQSLESWTLPQGARNFEASVYCSTDHSNTTCRFGSASEVPALSEMILTLEDPTPPVISAVNGSLASAAASHTPIAGTQELGFTGSDTDSGVLSAKLTITPQAGGAPATHTFDFSGECTYSSWNACPVKQVVSGYGFDTSTLKDGTYTVDLALTDAAGNTTNDPLGSLITHNAPSNTSAPVILGAGALYVGVPVGSQAGSWSAPSGAGNITYTYQWQDCDTHGENCQAIGGAQSPTYTPAPSDVGHTLRVLAIATDNDGSSTQASPASSIVGASQGSQGAAPGPGTGGSSGSTGGSGGLPAGGSPSGGGSLGQPLTTVALGVANGSGASESAQLTLGVKRSLTVSYRRRAFKLSGRLSTGGRPIGGATLAIIAQTAGSTGSRTIAQAHTRANGTFSLRVPAGPSRTITVTYRAFSGDAGYAAQARVKETVRAGAQLQITPREVLSPEGEIALVGRVDGPMPHYGVIVDLIVHYKGHWVPIPGSKRESVVHTDATGHFLVSYKFEGATGRFPFRAEIPGGQAGLPYARGYSNTINVKAN